MVIHSYCSYTYSAVGYQYGTYNVSTPSADGDFSDTENQKLSIISAAFDSGMIRELYGKYNDYYLYLVKKLKYESLDDIEVGKELFINIAFSFSLDEKEEFYAFKENISALSNDEKAERIATLFIIDTASKFGLKIDSHAVQMFVTEMEKDCSSEIQPNDNDVLSIKCIAADKNYSEKLANALHLPAEYLSQDDADPKCYLYPKKRDAVADVSTNNLRKKNAIATTMNSKRNPLELCLMAISVLFAFLILAKNARLRWCILKKR